MKCLCQLHTETDLCVTTQELNCANYLELYRVADLFHLPVLEEAVVAFLVKHLSELSRSRQDEALQLPYRLLQEVLKSDRLTCLSEEEIWKVPGCPSSVCFPLHAAVRDEPEPAQSRGVRVQRGVATL